MKLDKKHIISWILYDFASSSYSAVIASVVFPVYYTRAIVGGSSGQGDLWWGRAISTSMALVALSSPFLGGIADGGRIRKGLLVVYTLLSVLAIAMLSLLKKGMALQGFFLIVLVNLGVEGGRVFYNSFLPRIAPLEFQGRVSGWGFGTGYAGSIFSLLMAFPFVRTGQLNVVWLMVAAFFLFFSMPAFFFLPSESERDYSIRKAGMTGFKQTLKTLREIWRKGKIRRFLISYLLYQDGVNTVIVFSSLFASATLDFAPQELIALFLVVQVSALLGAFGLARPTDTWGPKRVVLLALLLWTAVSMIAFFVQTKAQFWILASVAGIGLGTVQAATRAFYAQFVPRENEAEYFGVFSLVGKSSAIAGPVIFGLISRSLGSQRPAILSVAAFFLIGMIILKSVEGGDPNIRHVLDEHPSGP